MQEHTNAGDRWIPEEDYHFICARVPILCVDLLPVIAGTSRFGLIKRNTYNGGRGLNLVGGGVLLDESLVEAVDRHVSATLGSAVSVDMASLALVGVYQYYRQPRPGELHDPRKNAVSITYAGIINGEPRAAGEALSFHTFELGSPPAPSTFGFGQGKVAYEALTHWRQLHGGVTFG
ncbi:DUF4916 domain-containing protein [Streptomyces indiaensis]|uniref:Uncharacterized protein n=1 Tax=Streptomyces indiaensis TaxID=284033 RepID=A0ABP5QA24_9ACTN|nr:DUF4916 domain-containing protein [Streptomyces indiaensis]MCF1644566.1 DUF4916 domain-containing protein [Streptomyces indiaensis]